MVAKKMDSLIARSRQKLDDFVDIAHEYGLRFAVEVALNSLGFTIYKTVNYPVNNVKATVSVSTLWKSLETGHWELNCLKYIFPLVKKNSVILDIGAWNGAYTLFFAILMQGTGRVYAFEPDPVAFDALRDNLEKNGLDNVLAERLCMSNHVGTAELKQKKHFGDTLSSIVGDASRGFSGGDIVKATTIDQYCQDNRILPDGIKIDVEGAEGLVVDGARNTLEKAHPWILLEFHRLLMSNEEARTNWDKIVGPARKIVFIDGDSDEYRCGDWVNRMPDCEIFHVFIQY
jgi:FkbM family methyltransferase